MLKATKGKESNKVLKKLTRGTPPPMYAMHPNFQHLFISQHKISSYEDEQMVVKGIATKELRC